MKLYQAAVILTDILRTKNYDVDLETPFNNIKGEYYKVLSALKRFANQ